MLKLFVCLLIVTQICCLAQEEERKDYKEDEIDLPTPTSKVDDKAFTEYDSKGIQNGELAPKPDFKDTKPENKEDKAPVNYEPGKEGNKPVDYEPGKEGNKPVDYEPGKDGNKPGDYEPGKDGNKPVDYEPGKDGNKPVDYEPGKDGNKPVDYEPGKDGNKPVDNEPGKDGNKPVDFNPGDMPKEEVDEKITKKIEKPLEYGTDVDLGKDYKKVDLKPEIKDKTPSDPNTAFGSENGFESEGKIPEKGLDEQDKYGSEQDKAYSNENKPLGPQQPNGNKVQIANQIMDNLLKLIKSDYRSDFEQVKLGKFEPFTNGGWGSVELHSGVVTGLTNAERAGDVVVINESDDKKLIVGDIAVKDVTADYKMNAKLFHKISFKDRDLKLWLKKAILSVKMEANKNEKTFVVKELNLNSFEGFGVKSGRLFWPFNKITDVIVKKQENVVKELIKKEFSQYMGKVVQNIQFDEVFAKLY